MREKIKLSGVPETILQTIYARAKESRGRGAIHDAKAEEIIEKLDYDFSLADKDTAMRSGVIARTIVLDRMTKEWLASHPGAVVVNIACGLDTRCYRMSGYAHWYNLDLPETMAVREKLLPESGTISQITMSAMEDWGSEISEQNVPVLIVIEGLTMYLSERNIQRIFTVISSRFSNATVFVETMNPTIVRHFKEKSIDASNAKFNWGIKNGKTLAELLSDFRFVEEHSLTEGMAAFAPVYKLLDRLPAVRNISNKIIVLEKELYKMSFFENTRKPVGLGGKLMVAMMNLGHSPVARWGLQFLNAAPDAKVLDCGCGGGANMKRLLKNCPQGIVKGIDYSPVSVEKTKKVNETAIAEGRCAVLQGSVADMIFADDWFDAVTAFETVYFWPDLPQCFREVCRVLKPGGTFLICNESSGDTDKDEKWTEIIGGMTIYKDVELKAYLEQVGFYEVQIHKKKSWLCITARK